MRSGMAVLRKTSTRVMLGLTALVLSVSSCMILNLSASANRATGVEELQKALDSILSDPRLGDAQASVLVRSASTGEVLYSKEPSTLLIPASNNKLYTSAAAFEVLGKDYTFETSVLASRAPKAGIIKGDLYLKGTGDPSMLAEDYDKLAQEIASKGVKLVTGKLVADDTHFDNRQLGYNWGWDSNPYYYQPEVSALTVAANSSYDISALAVEVSPSTAGKPAAITTNPATNYVMFQNETITSAAGSASTISVERKLGINTIAVKGSIAADAAPKKVVSTVTDPTGYAASVFSQALKKHGVRVLDHKIGRQKTPAAAQKLTAHTVALQQILPQFMKLSNNGIAEILVKSMGAKDGQQGTWRNGLDKQKTALQALGIKVERAKFVDGSGLSNVNFTNVQHTSDLLLAVQSRPWFDAWYNSLPIAGNTDPLVGGTLRSRMKGTPAENNVRAKTGSLDSVSALSGYVTSKDGEKLIFSVMENNYIFGSVKPLEDTIAATLASFSRESGVQKQAVSARTLKQADAKNDALECSWTAEGC